MKNSQPAFVNATISPFCGVITGTLFNVKTLYNCEHQAFSVRRLDVGKLVFLLFYSDISLDIVKYTTEIPHEGEEICHVQKAVRHTIFIRGQCPGRHRIRWEGGENELLNSQLILKEKMAAYHNILVVCIQGFVFLFHSH